MSESIRETIMRIAASIEMRESIGPISLALRDTHLTNFIGTLPVLVAYAYGYMPDDENAESLIQSVPEALAVLRQARAVVAIAKEQSTNPTTLMFNCAPSFHCMPHNGEEAADAKEFYGWMHRCGYTIRRQNLWQWLQGPDYINELGEVGGSVDLLRLVELVCDVDPSPISIRPPQGDRAYLPLERITKSTRWFWWGQVKPLCQEVYVCARDSIIKKTLIPLEPVNDWGQYHLCHFHPKSFHRWFVAQGYTVNPKFDAAIMHWENRVEWRLARETALSMTQELALPQTEKSAGDSLATDFTQSGAKNQPRWLNQIDAGDWRLRLLKGDRPLLADRGLKRLGDGLKRLKFNTPQ